MNQNAGPGLRRLATLTAMRALAVRSALSTRSRGRPGCALPAHGGHPTRRAMPAVGVAAAVLTLSFAFNPVANAATLNPAAGSPGVCLITVDVTSNCNTQVVVGSGPSATAYVAPDLLPGTTTSGTSTGTSGTSTGTSGTSTGTSGATTGNSGTSTGDTGNSGNSGSTNNGGAHPARSGSSSGLAETGSGLGLGLVGGLAVLLLGLLLALTRRRRRIQEDPSDVTPSDKS